MTHVPAPFRVSGILVAALIASLSSGSFISAQTTTPPPKKKAPAPPLPPPKTSNPPAVVTRYNSVIAVAAASNLANTPYAPAGAPTFTQLSTYPASSPYYYPGPIGGGYPLYPQVPSYYPPLMNPAFPYQTSLAGISPFAMYQSQALSNYPLSYNPYSYGMYPSNPFLQAFPSYGLYQSISPFQAFPGLSPLGQPSPLAMQLGLYPGVNFPGTALPQFTGLASWNNPFGIGLGLGGLGN